MLSADAKLFIAIFYSFLIEKGGEIKIYELPFVAQKKNKHYYGLHGTFLII